MSTTKVEEYLDGLDHPFRAQVAELRLMISQSDDRVTEGIKWNAPSFSWQGNDRVTLKLNPKNCFQIIFHRGAKKDASDSNGFEDRSGIVEWIGPDRGIVRITSPKEFENVKELVADIAIRWMKANE